MMALLSGCAARPEAPILQAPGNDTAQISTRLETLLPTDVLILGEQHDAVEHQTIEQEVVTALAAKGVLAAVALEMADTGASTSTLRPSATEQQVRNALKWNDKGWPWVAYGPAVMTAVRAGVPVLGANLPRAQMPASMADSQLDARLPGPALKAQQQLIRTGHCNLLPESQITPMTRIQIAKDITMANTLAQAALPGKTVLLLAGSGHADRQLGVPQHLPADLKAKAVRLRAGGVGNEQPEVFDAVWTTPALPEKDYCAGLEKRLAPKP
ncbi:ChaN family lipoprotein [Polaromonas aquatica]|uniref:ChaN family lipoprotein n=1 Tax=Polaromonas aquatica TaxID=332657 RepID=UPI003D65222C